MVADISGRVTELQKIRRRILVIAGKAPLVQRSRLLQRIGRLAPEVQLDPQRLAAEVALLADRVDVTEELVRLEAHLGQLSSVLRTSAAGRKLDFLLQEVGREFNTIGSKAQDALAQQLVVDAKTVLEKIREQAQNLE